MNWLSKVLRRLRVLPNFTQDDILNAETEDALMEHKKVVDEVNATTHDRKLINAKLRGVLSEARERSSHFADFEQSLKRDRRRVRRTLD